MRFVRLKGRRTGEPSRGSASLRTRKATGRNTKLKSVNRWVFAFLTVSLTEEADKTKGCVLVTIRQILECIYDDQIGASPRIQSPGDTQQTGYLA